MGLEVVLRSVLKHYKSHQWLWQVEEEYEDHLQVKALMESLEGLQVCFQIIIERYFLSRSGFKLSLNYINN